MRTYISLYLFQSGKKGKRTLEELLQDADDERHAPDARNAPDAPILHMLKKMINGNHMEKRVGVASGSNDDRLAVTALLLKFICTSTFIYSHIFDTCCLVSAVVL